MAIEGDLRKINQLKFEQGASMLTQLFYNSLFYEQNQDDLFKIVIDTN